LILTFQAVAEEGTAQRKKYEVAYHQPVPLSLRIERGKVCSKQALRLSFRLTSLDTAASKPLARAAADAEAPEGGGSGYREELFPQSARGHPAVAEETLNSCEPSQ
jgi:hypothetical protein